MKAVPIAYAEILDLHALWAHHTGYSPVWGEGSEAFGVYRSACLAGFAALGRRGSTGVLSSAYVRPEHRREGLYKALVRARVERASALGLAILVAEPTTPWQAGFMESEGFVVENQAGNYLASMTLR